jgi:hypothetical protein
MVGVRYLDFSTSIKRKKADLAARLHLEWSSFSKKVEALLHHAAHAAISARLTR